MGLSLKEQQRKKWIQFAFLSGLKRRVKNKDWKIILFDSKDFCQEIKDNALLAYKDEMISLSEKYDFAPGKLEYGFFGCTFYYKGTEIIYIFPWERRKKNPITFLETKDCYSFNNFYDYVKYRYAKDLRAK